jgi:serine/threonine protein kinase
MQGGELFSRVLKSGGGLPPSDVKFYAACAIEGLDYLHRKRIAYRDLKLENLVIGTDGYLKIIDFGFAKQLQEGELTRTLCGTPDYLAPEAVTRTGHNHLVDCWGFGVLLYEMLTQYSPFADSTCSGNRVIVFQNIIRGVRHVDWNELARPFRTSLDRLAAKGQLDPLKIRKINEEFDHVQDLLYRVWDSNPLTRASAMNIKAHQYFADWNWAALRELSLESPWTPELEGQNDLRYFDIDSFKDVKECDFDFDGPTDMFAEFGRD